MIQLLQKEKNPTKGLFLFEWAVLAYTIITLVMILICFAKLVTPMEMVGLRLRVIIIMAMMWGIYRLVPCRLMVFVRMVSQMVLLSAWYADTYEINRILPNLDHIFATMDQTLFGCQPSLRFSEVMSWNGWSEMMYLGYYSYFYLFATTIVMYFFMKYDDFLRMSFIILGSFFVFYIIFDFLPVVGPQYYYAAIGLDNAAHGVFPDVGSYFINHQEMVPAPGTEGSLFRSFVHSGAVAEGERPTAAFPSSHVGITTVTAFLLAKLCRSRRDWRPFYVFTPLAVLLCMATVYIHAHYLVDAIAGFFTGAAFYFGMNKCYDIMKK